MAKFKYSARKPDGTVEKGEIESDDRATVVDTLQDTGLLVVSVDEKISLMDSINQINIGGVPMDDKVVFMRQLSTMISAGLPLSRALEILVAQAENPQFKKVLENVYHDVQGGNTLASSFRKQANVFDDVVLNLIKAGEDSGNLDQIFGRLADELESQREFQAKVKGAMIYPIIIAVVIVVVIVLVMVFMIPIVADLYADFGSELPKITQVMVSISDFMRKFWWLCILLILASAVGFKYYIDTDTGRRVWDDFQLKFPIMGVLFQKIQLAKFTQTFALLVGSGIPILDALDLVADSLSNIHFKEGVKEAAREVEKGSPMAIPLSKNERFPLIVSQMVGVGEETGQLDKLLSKLAEYYGDEVSRMTDNLTSMMEPIMLIVMGVVIGFVAVAVYSPMFSLANVIG